METLLEYIAYGSLILDFAIAALTLVTVNVGGTSNLADIQTLVNYAITAVLIVSAVLFVTIKVMVHYERIIDGFARIKTAGNRHLRRRH